ncbi:MAG: PHP domain-containing protein [Clostridia bacterium]|nr:PHP domain-containing protein [Clostridia bacterium]
MTKYLLPETGTFYKANLHCHSNLSDGLMTPEELKARYKSMGYSVLSITDHEILLPHPELNDETFLTLNGYEMGIKDLDEPIKARARTCHMCLIALEEKNRKQVCWHPEKYVKGNALDHRHKICFDENTSPYERAYTGECISDMMRIARENGFFVTYNHPSWSLESYPEYMSYHHMHAMEICNYGCIADGFPDYDPRVYDDMLRGGKRIFCLGTDDNHNTYDTCGAWIMIKADRLEYRSITRALEQGHFYSSRGPEIHSLRVEDGRLVVETSSAREICFACGNRYGLRLKAAEGELLHGGSYELPEGFGYVRVTVIDEAGLTADTNAYFEDEIL